MGINKYHRRTGTIVDETGNLDAFSRIRMSRSFTLFDAKLESHTNPLQWNTVVDGGGVGVYQPQIAAMTLGVTTGGDGVTHQSREYINYQPGKSQLVILTCVLKSTVSGVTKRIGLFDDDNGLFFKQSDDGGISVGIRSNAFGPTFDTEVNQSDWNIDKGQNIDFTLAQIFFIDFQWLGVGRVRFGVFQNGKPLYLHEEVAANSSGLVYMATPNLPVRYEIDSTSGSSSMDCICATVVSEGGDNPRDLEFTATQNTQQALPANTPHPIVSIRNGLACIRKNVIPVSFSGVYSTADRVRLELWLNPVLTGPSWTAVNDATCVEQDVSATAMDVNSAYLLSATSVAAQQRGSGESIREAAFKMGGNFAGDTADIVTLAMRSIGGGANNATGEITFREVL